SWVADHFQYLASAGPIALFAAATTTWADRLAHMAAGKRARSRPLAIAAAGAAAGAATWSDRLRPFSARALLCASALVPALLGALTWHQCHIYKDAETLWRDTLARNPGAWMAHSNL